MALLALLGLGGLLVLAVYAPLLASDLPLTMMLDGERSYPFFANLFNRSYYEGSVDLSFNQAIFTLPIAVLLLLFTGRRRLLRWAAVAVLLLPAVWVCSDPLSSLSSRPEVGLAGVLGWYEAPFPQPRAQLQRAEAEGREYAAVFPPVAYSFRATSRDISQPPSWQHPLGTDHLGRDVMARLLFGTRIALVVGILSVLLYLAIGVPLGALSGYLGGRFDLLVQRLIEVMLCFPSLFLIMTLAAIVQEASIFHVMLIIGLTRWTEPARLVRAEFLRLRNEDFVQAARASGARSARVIFRHILPNAMGPVLVTATFGVAGAILIESTLSFLGLGNPSLPTWGKILNDGRVFRNTTMILAPGLAIFLSVSLLNLLGEALRDALDPKLRGGDGRG
jgi:peptide/nickel transport system permease protein